jgi:CBS domain-containing protein
MSTRTVRARDLMRTDVAQLSPQDTIETAIGLFEDSGISGAPVVANGRLVGVLTLADISRPEHLDGDRIETRRDYELSEPAGEELTDEVDPDEVFFAKDDYSPEVLGRDLVGDWMTPEVITVPPEASLKDVCSRMVERQIHRVFVTDEKNLMGVISSFDVVRHVAQSGRREKRST